MEVPEISTSQIECNHCDTPINEDISFCPECGYPVQGDEQDVAKFYAKRVINKRKTSDAKRKIKSARNILYVIAGFIMLFGIFMYFKDGDFPVLVVNIVIGGIYIFLGSWSEQRPLVALLLGLLLYLTTVVISAIAEPATLVSGIIWKVLIIAYLGKGIYSASSLNKAM
ncbi:zinc ribbon domain-containing protein [Olleya sp. YS]|uniref:zinc ribbon domain-containing protein n=1 Tax=Olleya sp. YS TaxID=3028318 RepID=UPI0024342DC9|nr:zinc ribbon domain-containing protein [Olleya sp. YS]WGD36119.1 zinc ribbon domain-containing protein [Olleya sp. YS]